MPESSRLELSENFSANNFGVSDEEDNSSAPLNRGGIADLFLLRILSICQMSQEPSSWEVTDSFVLSEYASLAASRNLLQWLLACMNFTLEAEALSFWYKRKKWFLWTMAAPQTTKNHKDEWGLTWYFQCWMDTSITTWTHSQNSPAAAEALILKIYFHGTSLNWSQRPSQSARE